MDLLDRYLEAVKKHLPWRRQDDIAAELRVNLESQLEDRESELGRVLTDAEVEAWLLELGPPLQMAARYRPQRFLIGPAIFPTYLYILRAVCLWVFVVYAIVGTVQIFQDKIPTIAAVLRELAQVPFVLLQTAAWVTLVFAAIEFGVTRYPSRFFEMAESSSAWKLSDLPSLQMNSPEAPKQRSFSRALAELAFGFVVLAWLVLIPNYPVLVLGPSAKYFVASPFALAQGVLYFFWWIVALNATQLTLRTIDLFRGTWNQPRQTQHLVVKAMGVVALLCLLNLPGRALLVLKRPGLNALAGSHSALLDTINRNAYHALLLVCAIAVVQLAWESGRLGLEAYRKRVAAMP